MNEPEIRKTAMSPADRMAKARAAKDAKRAAAALQSPSGEAEVQAAPIGRRTARTQVRQTQPREAVREPTRTKSTVVGRNGEELARRRTGGVDPFHIPPEIVPKGWTYQWNVVSVTGNEEIVLDQSLGMYENGWRPVPAERHPGMFVARAKTGNIIRGGQRLEERPVTLTKDAKAEDERTASQLISDRNDSLKLSGVNKNMPDGFEMNKRYRGTGGNIKMSIDQALDIPTPNYDLAEPGE